MSQPRSSSLTFSGRLRSVRYALRGCVTMLKTQHNAWLHATVTVLVVSVGLALSLSRIEWCLIALAIAAVWTAEALNTALEYLVDVASPDFHPRAGHAKDVAAGAVLITAVGAAIVGLLVFVPHLVDLAKLHLKMSL